MANISEASTKEQCQEFLLFHMDSVDDSVSKVNPSLTKKEMWDILMGGIMESSVKTHHLIVKNMIKEFGPYYEAEGESV